MALPALPTAFIKPATCSDIFTTTAVSATLIKYHFSDSNDGIGTPVPTVYKIQITVSDAADPRFTTCQPPGWPASVASESRFDFSPAVCPSGWTAYNLDTAGATSTAYCCASGYYLAWPTWATVDGIQTPGCFKHATPSGYGDDFYQPTDILVHNAYRIAWEPSNTATMTPQPPNITCGYTKSWVPGSPATSSPCPTSYNDSAPGYGAIGFLQIGLPIIIVAGLLFIGGLCCYYSSQEKEEKRMQAHRAARAAREQDDAIEAGRAESLATSLGEVALPAASPGQVVPPAVSPGQS